MHYPFVALVACAVFLFRDVVLGEPWHVFTWFTITESNPEVLATLREQVADLLNSPLYRIEIQTMRVSKDLPLDRPLAHNRGLKPRISFSNIRSFGEVCRSALTCFAVWMVTSRVSCSTRARDFLEALY